MTEVDAYLDLDGLLEDSVRDGEDQFQSSAASNPDNAKDGSNVINGDFHMEGDLDLQDDVIGLLPPEGDKYEVLEADSINEDATPTPTTSPAPVAKPEPKEVKAGALSATQDKENKNIDMQLQVSTKKEKTKTSTLSKESNNNNNNTPATPSTTVPSSSIKKKTTKPNSNIPSGTVTTPKKLETPKTSTRTPTCQRVFTPKRTPKNYIDEEEEAPVGPIICDNTYMPNLQSKRGPCQVCVFRMSDEEKAKFELNKRHLAVNMTRGGCMTCRAFPSQEGEDPVRICRLCFFNTHKLKPYCAAPFSGSPAMTGMSIVQDNGRFVL